MSKKGYKHTEEAKRKMSEAKKGECSKIRGVPKSPEHREKIRQSMLGRKASEETRDKMRQARVGMKFTDEHRANLSAAVIASIEKRKNNRI